MQTVRKRIPNPTGDYFICSIRLFPGYDKKNLPYIIVRDMKGISLFDVKNEKSYLFYNSAYEKISYNAYKMEVIGE